MQKKVFERTGLIPRSIIRTFDRFLQQLLPGTENLAIQEYRVSRYQILVSIKSLVTIICIPLFVNYTVKSFILTPLTEHFWNSQEGQIFINTYQEKRAFLEMQDFSEKIFFESLLQDSPSVLINQSVLGIRPEWSSSFSKQFSDIQKSTLFSSISNLVNPLGELETLQRPVKIGDSRESTRAFSQDITLTPSDPPKELDFYVRDCHIDWCYETLLNKGGDCKQANEINNLLTNKYRFSNKKKELSMYLPLENHTNICLNQFDLKNLRRESINSQNMSPPIWGECVAPLDLNNFRQEATINSKNMSPIRGECFAPIDLNNDYRKLGPIVFIYSKKLQDQSIEKSLLLQKRVFQEIKISDSNLQSKTPLLGLGSANVQRCSTNLITIPYGGRTPVVGGRDQGGIRKSGVVRVKVQRLGFGDENFTERIPESELSELSMSSETLNLQKLFQLKSVDIAYRYNKQSILAITNLLGDFITFFTIYVLFVIMKPQIIILKSFLTESIYSLSDTTKSFLLILGMDLLVGFHSPRGWEIILEVLLRHLGLPENENFILLFVALFPVFLDTVFKYWIFRYLNKISPSTVVTYHSMLE